MADDLSTNTKALVFDLMGTCCDWHTGIVNAMQQLPAPSGVSQDTYSDLALAWRAGFFAEIHERFKAVLPQEDIDTTHRRVLDSLLASHESLKDSWDDTARETLVKAWHTQTPWPDVIPALERIRASKKYYLVVLANGTTALQLSIVSSANLPFHTLLSSQLLNLTKPNPEIYRRAAELMGVSVEECVMVASHAYDVRAARGVGMRSVYVRRWTEDVGEDFGAVEDDVDLFLEGREGAGRGFEDLVDWLGA
jgi:2-haloalkanoic acid dehalogenase type II